MREEDDRFSIVENLEGVFWAGFLLYAIPSIIILVWNFFSIVVFGGYELSFFRANWEGYSIRVMNQFYLNIWRWIVDSGYRLFH
jgi:hypothetical protein